MVEILLSFNREYLTSVVKMPHGRILELFKQMSDFERCRSIVWKEAGERNQNISPHLGQSDARLNNAGESE